MILKGRVGKRVSEAHGLRISVGQDAYGKQTVRISLPLAVDLGLAKREDNGWYFEGIPQDVEIEIREVSHDG